MVQVLGQARDTADMAPPDDDKRAQALLDIVGCKLWPEQEEIRRCRERFIIVTGGEQGGKSLTASKFFLTRWPEDLAEHWDGSRTLIYWLVGADYDATQEEFDFIRDDFVAILGVGAVRASKRVDPGYIEIKLPGDLKPCLRLETKSGKDPRKIRRVAPQGIIVCEAGQLELATFERLRGRTAPRKAWMILPGTLEGSLGWFPSVAEAWRQGQKDRRSFELPSWVNRTLYPGGRSDPEILALEAESSDAYFMERIAGKRVPPTGLVFSEFRADIHVRDVQWVPGVPITITVDPGYAGAHALLAIQEINGQECVFAEIYETEVTTEDMISIAQAKPWWRDVDKGVIDVAGRQHQAMAAPVEVWLAKAGLYMESERILEAEGRERLKTFLIPHRLTGVPQLVISPDCPGILSEFGAVASPLQQFQGQDKPYRWKTDREGNVVGQHPEDKNNHSIKSLTYYVVSKHGYAKSQNRDKIKTKRW